MKIGITVLFILILRKILIHEPKMATSDHKTIMAARSNRLLGNFVRKLGYRMGETCKVAGGSETKMATKRRYEDEVDDDSDHELPGIPAHIKKQEKRLIVILERANLESVKVGNKFELLNCDDHISQIKRFNKDPAHCRPDITHQCLLMLFDSPLNRAGLLQVYIHTERNVLIEINPQTRIPRTFKRFAGLIVQLLHKLCIRASDGPHKLLKVIKNPVTDHLPVGCRKIGTSFSAPKTVKPVDLVPKTEEPIAIVIGAMAHGKVDVDYTEDIVAISEYPLSAALTCTKLCTAFEEAWGIQ